MSGDVGGEERAALVERCRQVGMTADEIDAAGDDLVEVAIRRAYGLGEAELTVDQVAERSGVDRARVEEILKASGVLNHQLDHPLFTASDVEAVRMFSAAEDLLGADAALQMIRVAAASMVRIGDAAISAFVTNMAAPAMREDESGLTLLEANIATAALIPPFGQTLTQILLRYLRDAFRPMSDEFIAGELGVDVDTIELAIGFADLVGSTAMAGDRSMAQLSAALDGFERTATEVVAAGGGRVVKFIGDEVMFRVADPDAACSIALDLVDRVEADPGLPPLRAGVAFGDVLSRDGDFYGPVVNLAARITKLAPLNGVVTTVAATKAVGADLPFVTTSLGPIEMNGISEPVELAAIARA